MMKISTHENSQYLQVPDALGSGYFQHIESTLHTAAVLHSRSVSDGSNHVELLTLAGGLRAIFKPGIGENCLEIEESCFNLYKRERAAYLVSQALGFNIVPPTIIRTIEKRLGSLQLFVEGQPVWESDQVFSRKSQMYVIALFDYLIWNKDRKLENMILSGSQLIPIDNGLSFDNWFEYILSRNLNSFVLNTKPQENVIKPLISFAQNIQKQQELRSQLVQLLPLKVVEAFFFRLELVIKCLIQRGLIAQHDVVLPEQRWGRNLKYDSQS